MGGKFFLILNVICIFNYSLCRAVTCLWYLWACTSNPQILHLIFSASIIARPTKKEHNNVTFFQIKTDQPINDQPISNLDIYFSIISISSGLFSAFLLRYFRKEHFETITSRRTDVRRPDNYFVFVCWNKKIIMIILSAKYYLFELTNSFTTSTIVCLQFFSFRCLITSLRNLVTSSMVSFALLFIHLMQNLGSLSNYGKIISFHVWF